MKPPLLYIAETLFCSGAFMLLWRTVLAGRISFNASRAFLLLSVAAAAIIPLLQLPLYPADAVFHVVPQIALYEPAQITFDEPAQMEVAAGFEQTETAAAVNLDWERILRVVYLSIAALSLVVAVLRCVKLVLLRRRCQKAHFDGYTIARSGDIVSPFSFMTTIFMPAEMPQEHFSRIVCHELSHIRHRHTLERIAMEIMRSVLWFNPFVWIAARSLAEVHEWQADRDVLDAGHDLTQYRTTIFRQLFGYNPDITCGLAHSNSITKKRFIMMTRRCGGKFASLRLTAAATLTAGLLLAFGCTARATATPTESENSQKPLYTIDLTGLTCTVNGETSDLESIAALLTATADSLRISGTVSILASNDTPYGDILKVKQLLRSHKFLRVNYLSNSGAGVSRIMPPLPEHGSDKVKVLPVDDIPDSELVVYILGTEGAQHYKDLTYLPLSTVGGERIGEHKFCMVAPTSTEKSIEDMVESHRQWIKHGAKETGDADYRYILLPDGKTRVAVCPQMTISFFIDEKTPYGNYIAVTQAFYNLYTELREEKAQEIFHKSLEQLSTEELGCIYKIVPIKIIETDIPPEYQRDYMQAVNYHERGEYSLAFDIWHKLAMQGDADSQYNLGLCYATGHGIEQDYTKAVYWLRESAEQGHKTAQHNLVELKTWLN